MAQIFIKKLSLTNINDKKVGFDDDIEEYKHFGPQITLI